MLLTSSSYFAVAVADSFVTLWKKVFLSIFVLNDIAELQHDGDVRSLSLSLLGDMLAGGGADDTNGLMTHKTPRTR